MRKRHPHHVHMCGGRILGGLWTCLTGNFYEYRSLTCVDELLQEPCYRAGLHEVKMLACMELNRMRFSARVQTFPPTVYPGGPQ